MSTPRTRLIDILSVARPHTSEAEIDFCRDVLDAVPGMRADDFGNRILHIPGNRVLWSCHVDTVAKRGGPQRVRVSRDGTISLRDGRAGMSLGADDGVGLWLMLEMIDARRPGLYVFHRGEEVGCLGSRWIATNTPELLGGIDAAVAFDRAGHSDVITHQASGRGCSDRFALAFADKLNASQGFRYVPDDTGVFTDTNEYFHLVPECSNISVGYHGQHGPRETTDLFHALKLREAMLAFDATDLPIERDPEDMSRGHDSSWRSGRYSDAYDDLDDMAALIEDNPEIAARMLMELGVTVLELQEEIFDRSRRTGRGRFSRREIEREREDLYEAMDRYQLDDGFRFMTQF